MVMTLRKLKLYLDTSVISFYFAEDAPEKMAVTRRFFDEELSKAGYEIYLSALTLEELGNCNDLALQRKLVEFVSGLPAIILESTGEVDAISKRLDEDGVIPTKYLDDAVHLGLALMSGMDYVVSWNFKHLVKPKTKKAVRILCIQEGYKEIEIVTPEEVADDETEI
jgi:predicted nucleic acid-binding protein